jgi:hypothetical protein
MPATAVGFARASAWAARSASTTPSWLAVVAVLACVLFAVCVVWLFAAGPGPHDRPDGEDNRGSGPGGGGRGPGGPPSSGPDGRTSPGDEPAWWPEFEREFAAYVAARTAGVA